MGIVAVIVFFLVYIAMRGFMVMKKEADDD